MALNRDDQDRIRGYLLGQLSDDEQQQIEERLMIEDDLFQELEISKDEVIENYCAGELTSNEREWLEQHFLASSEGKLRRSFARALNSVKTVNPVKPLTPKPLTLIERFQSLWRTQPLAIAAAASVFVVALVAIVYYLSLPGKSSVAVTLISATATRGESSSPRKVILPPDAGEVRISLMLPASSTAGANYRAELVDEIQSLPIAGRDANSISVVIPAAQLRRDSYAIRLYAIKADGTEERIPGSYFFNVE